MRCTRRDCNTSLFWGGKCMNVFFGKYKYERYMSISHMIRTIPLQWCVAMFHQLYSAWPFLVPNNNFSWCKQLSWIWVELQQGPGLAHLLLNRGSLLAAEATGVVIRLLCYILARGLASPGPVFKNKSITAAGSGWSLCRYKGQTIKAMLKYAHRKWQLISTLWSNYLCQADKPGQQLFLT